jgi:hypothetical protein
MSDPDARTQDRDKALWFGMFVTTTSVVTLVTVLTAHVLAVPAWGVVTAGAGAFVVTLSLLMATYNWFRSGGSA